MGFDFGVHIQKWSDSLNIMEIDVWCEVDEWFIDVIELIEGTIQWSST